MTTTYEKKGDQFVLNGVKYLISNGGIADAVVVFGYPAGVPEGDPKRRITAFVVDTDAKGFEAESFAPNAKMGMPTSNTAMFEMHDVRRARREPARRPRATASASRWARW